MVDESTFESFYQRTKQSLWLYVVRMMKDEDLADDVFQDTYIRFLHSNIDHLNESQMKSYLYRIATNRMRDHWRTLKRERRWFAAETEEPSVQTSVEMDLRHDLANALQHLASQERAMVWLAYVEEYSHKEIAEMFKLREKSIKVLLHRAKRKLLEIFKHKGITSEAAS